MLTWNLANNLLVSRKGVWIFAKLVFYSKVQLHKEKVCIFFGESSLKNVYYFAKYGYFYPYFRFVIILGKYVFLVSKQVPCTLIAANVLFISEPLLFPN